MRAGDFATAWTISDETLSRRVSSGAACWHWPRHLQYVWNGQAPDDRRVLVRCYHGLGDTLQFVRLLEPLRQRAREITLWAQPMLLDVLRSVRGIDHLLPLHDGIPDAAYDVDMELSEVLHVLRVQHADLARRMPYVGVPHQPSAPSTRLRVGLCWQAGAWDSTRSIPSDLLERWRGVAADWFALQYPPPRHPPLLSRNLACRRIDVLAQRMWHLHLIVTVDTYVAHLAGAMCLPVWLLLPHRSDWRWMSARSDSPWYPTMRLFRQPRPGDWRSVIDAVNAALTIRARDIR